MIWIYFGMGFVGGVVATFAGAWYIVNRWEKEGSNG